MSDTTQRFSTRTNSQKLIHQRFNTNIRKHSFSVRVSKAWNKLPDSIINAPSINTFKNRLDKHWGSEDLYYDDFKAEITGSHNRNEGNINIIEESGEEEPIGSCTGNHP